MDYLSAMTGSSSISGGSNTTVYIFVVVGIALALVIWAVASFFWNRSNTMPKAQGFEDASGSVAETEGFFGGVAVGSGDPDCLRTSSEAAQVYALFANRASSTEEGHADLQEFRLLLSKLACFKKDLIGTAAVVEATRYQAYATSMDIEPIGETTARCFAKTIPSRDLDIILDKWTKRGTELIRRLCTSMDVSEMESVQAETLYSELLRDVSDVARSVCLSGEPTINGKEAPRQAGGFEPPALQELGEYKGYY
jgi:hypothetical protein